MPREKRQAPSRENGIALVMAIIFIAVCLVIATALIQYVITDYRASHQDWRQVQALYCAEAGIDRACGLLADDPSYRASFTDDTATLVSGASGSYTVTITPVNDPIGSLKITSVGTVENMSRTIVGIYGSMMWDFGMDAVRARRGIEYASNRYMTVVVDSSYNVISDPSTDASVRVTGTGATIGAVDSVAANKATVAGHVSAPGWVDVPWTNATGISELNPANYFPNAFPDASVLGSWDADNNLIWPPTGDTWARMYYNLALAGGTSTASSGSFTGSKFIELGGTGTLTNATLTGPGTVFVHGDLGGNVTNGDPPVTLVVSGNFETDGSEFYRFNDSTPGGSSLPASLITFGPEAAINGNSTWYLNGPLMALNPNGEVSINDSAITCFGAILGNGMVNFKSNWGALGYPQTIAGKHFVARSLPKLGAYSAQ